MLSPKPTKTNIMRVSLPRMSAWSPARMGRSPSRFALFCALLWGVLDCWGCVVGSHVDDVRVINRTHGSIKIDVEGKILGPVAAGETQNCGNIFRSSVIRFRVLTGPNFRETFEDWTLEPKDLDAVENGTTLTLTVPLSSGPGHPTAFVGDYPVSVPARSRRP